MTSVHLRIGTRASRLALWQARWVAEQLSSSDTTVELVEITTRGDVERKGPILSLGSQGVFTKEIQAAVLDGRVDLAVHSLKDLPTESVPGLTLAAVTKREDPTDALVSANGASLDALPAGAKVGTGSLRRQAQLNGLRPDLQVMGIRGNVETRLRKVESGECDAVVLATAGLQRLNLASKIVERLGPPRMLPAPGQGALGIECRANDAGAHEIVGRLEDSETRAATDAERSMLALLHAGCSAPVGAWGRMVGESLHLDGLVASLDGVTVLRASASGSSTAAEALARQVAELLLEQGAEAVIQSARPG